MTPVQRHEGSLSSVAFATSQSGWTVGDNGTMLHTEDGGKTRILVQQHGSRFSAVIFANSQSGWAVGDNGTILHTEDGGKSWTPQMSNTKESLSSVAFATSQSGWAMGDNARFGTEDGRERAGRPR